MATTLVRYHSHVMPLLTPTHRYLPFGIIDLYGAARLSSIINWIASGAFDPPDVAQNGKKRKIKAKKERASLLQELAGLMIVVFGGETFLSMCTGSTPSWLLDPKVALLFCGAHILQTRTPLVNFLPSKPTLTSELLLSLPDAIGRALLLTKFSVIPLLHPMPGSKTLPATPTSLILVPFILAVPFASIAFSTLNLFSPKIKLDTPLELQSHGWAYADTWLPVVVPALFLTLIGPVEGWNMGLSWTEEEALVACIAVTWATFAGRAIYNYGGKGTSISTEKGKAQ